MNTNNFSSTTREKPSFLWRLPLWIFKGVMLAVTYIFGGVIFLSAYVGSWFFGVLSFYFLVELHQHWGGNSAMLFSLKFAGSFVAFMACFIFVKMALPKAQTARLSTSDLLLLTLRR